MTSSTRLPTFLPTSVLSQPGMTAPTPIGKSAAAPRCHEESKTLPSRQSTPWYCAVMVWPFSTGALALDEGGVLRLGGSGRLGDGDGGLLGGPFGNATVGRPAGLGCRRPGRVGHGARRRCQPRRRWCRCRRCRAGVALRRSPWPAGWRRRRASPSGTEQALGEAGDEVSAAEAVALGARPSAKPSSRSLPLVPLKIWARRRTVSCVVAAVPVPGVSTLRSTAVEVIGVVPRATFGAVLRSTAPVAVGRHSLERDRRSGRRRGGRRATGRRVAGCCPPAAGRG